MARKITDFNGTVIPVDATYPYGQIKDDPGGTTADRTSNGDLQQFFQRILADAGITANDLEDNAVNGFQLVQALNTLYCRRFNGMASAFGTPIGTFVPVVMSGFTPVAFGFSSGYFFYNGIFYFAPAFVNGVAPGPGSGIVVALVTSDAQPVGSGSIATTVTNNASVFNYSSRIESPILSLQDDVTTLQTQVALSAWTNLSGFGTLWASGSAGAVARYVKDGVGRVYFQGSAVSTSSTSTTILTLPVGVRPTQTIGCIIYGQTTLAANVAIFVAINTAGNVIVTDSSQLTGLANVYLSSIPPFLTT